MIGRVSTRKEHSTRNNILLETSDKLDINPVYLST